MHSGNGDWPLPTFCKLKIIFLFQLKSSCIWNICKRLITMQLLLGIFSAFVILVIVNANDCQISKYNTECLCVSDWPYINMSCPPSDSVSTKSFQIIYLPDKFVEITCKNNPIWSDFHFEIRLATKAVERFVLLNCKLDENTNLTEIGRLVGAENATSLEFSNNLKYKSLNLRKNHLEGFPNVEKLTINENHLLEDLTEDLLKPLPKVKRISLRNNNIKIIPKNFFTYVPELKFLELSGNNIQSFDLETFKSLKNLISLNLWNNEITGFSSISFDGLVSLKILDLYRNNFTKLSAEMFNKLKKLKVLNLSDRHLKSLPGNLFQNNHELNSVKLRLERNLMSLPNGLFSNLKNLKVVQLDGSKLENLPEDLFRGSPELKDIFLNGTSLRTLPKTIFKGLTKLQTLLLNNNMIEYLPDDIFSTNENLLELNLDHNQIKNISG